MEVMASAMVINQELLAFVLPHPPSIPATLLQILKHIKWNIPSSSISGTPSSLLLRNKQSETFLHERPVSIIWQMVPHELTYGLGLPMSLQHALADDGSVVNDETFDMGLDSDGNDWITASEDDGEFDNIIGDLCSKHQEAGIQIVVYFSVMLT